MKTSTKFYRWTIASAVLLAFEALFAGVTPLGAVPATTVFTSYPAGDDITTSLGQFQLVLDQRWVKTFDAIMANSPLANVDATRHHKVYHRGVFLSPTLYDPNTTIGRSDSFDGGGPEEIFGVLAGQAPGRTFVKESQLTVRPPWLGPTDGRHQLHTFLKSMKLTDSFTTRAGFAVRAGLQAPTRPVSAGEVQAGNGTNDFPAQSFFNVFVEVDLPGGGPLPPIHLVNIEPLLVEQTNIFSFPPRIVYQHGNSSAVSMYFNAAFVMPDPLGGPDIHVERGTLFGQLTLAGHGVGFAETEIESFQNEIENEMAASMPINPAPVTVVQIDDYAPDYAAAPPTLAVSRLSPEGGLLIAVTNAVPHATNYLQVSADLNRGGWQTIATNVPPTNSFLFTDPAMSALLRRFYRWTAFP